MDFKITSNNCKNTELSFKAQKQKYSDIEPKKTGSKRFVVSGIAAAAVSAAAIGGIAFAAHKHKLPAGISSILKPINKGLNGAEGKTEEALNLAAQPVNGIYGKPDEVFNLVKSLEKKIDEVCTLFQNSGKGCDDGVICKIVPNTDDKIVADSFLEEYLKNGTLARRTGFIDGIPTKIEEFSENQKTKNIINYNWFEGGIEDYTERYEKLADGSEQFSRYIEFLPNNTPNCDSKFGLNCLYIERCEANSSLKKFIITNGELQETVEVWDKPTL